MGDPSENEDDGSDLVATGCGVAGDWGHLEDNLSLLPSIFFSCFLSFFDTVSYYVASDGLKLKM